MTLDMTVDAIDAPPPDATLDATTTDAATDARRDLGPDAAPDARQDLGSPDGPIDASIHDLRPGGSG